MNKTYPKNRQHQILGLLQKHGTLTAGTLQAMLEPPINKRRLFDYISRLAKRGFIQKRWGWYYQIHQRDHGIKKVARRAAVTTTDVSSVEREPYRPATCSL